MSGDVLLAALDLPASSRVDQRVPKKLLLEHGAPTAADKRFGAIASRGQMPVLVRSHVLRFTIFTGAVLALGGVSQVLEHFPRGWLVTWSEARKASVA